jgi:hypothetical protein
MLPRSSAVRNTPRTRLSIGASGLMSIGFWGLASSGDAEHATRALPACSYVAR